MNKFNDHSPKTRLLKILLALLEKPNGYTKKQLAELYHVHEDTIKKDFDEIRNAGFTLTFDPQYRYALGNDTAFEYLKDLLYITDEDQTILNQAIMKIDKNSGRLKRLQEKISTIHDVTLLGSHLINKPFLSKVNILENAKKNKKVVKLIDYRSTNSSQVTNRRVEAFHISPKDDMVQTYDLDTNALRHYRLSRISRIELEKPSWTNIRKHHIEATDPFRITGDHQINVHILLKVGGYNELAERFPMTQNYIRPSAHLVDVYELECKVNRHFYGLANFLLGYHEHVLEILEPEALKTHLQAQIKKIKYA